MEFIEVVRKRRMIRHFTSEPVAPEVIDRLLELTRHAPSAGFTQGQAFIVVTRPELRKAIGRICGEDGSITGGFHPFVSEARSCSSPAPAKPPTTAAIWNPTSCFQTAAKSSGPYPTGTWISAAP
jgi:nitroreductase